MKPFKVLLLLAVFCLTVSGNKADKEIISNSTHKIEKSSYDVITHVKKKKAGVQPVG